MSQTPEHPVLDVTQRYHQAGPGTKKVWMALMVFHEGGLSLAELAELCGEAESVVRDVLVDLRATDRAVVQRGSHYLPAAAPSREESAFFHEEMVQHLIATGQDRRAIDLLYRTALLHQQLNDVCGQADDLGNIGALLLRGRQFERARAVFHEALVLHEAQGHCVGQGRDWANLGVVAAYLGQRAEAIRCLKRARAFFEEAGEAEMLQRTSDNLRELEEDGEGAS